MNPLSKKCASTRSRQKAPNKSSLNPPAPPTPPPPPQKKRKSNLFLLFPFQRQQHRLLESFRSQVWTSVRDWATFFIRRSTQWFMSRVDWTHWHLNTYQPAKNICNCNTRMRSVGYIRNIFTAMAPRPHGRSHQTPPGGGWAGVSGGRDEEPFWTAAW